MQKKQIIETLIRDGFILAFNQDQLDIIETGGALLEAGIHNIEVTCRISRPLEKIARLREELPEMFVGAASLIDSPNMLNRYNGAHPDDPLPSLAQAAEAGAHYLVSAAGFQPDSYNRYASTLPMIPGCGSVSEIVNQFALGAAFCKVFPAKQLGGPGFIKAIDPAIHKTISLIPMGGTQIDNIPDYLNTGVLVLGGSFNMIDNVVFQMIVEQQDYSLLADELKKVKQLIDRHRGNRWPDIDFKTASLDQIKAKTQRDFNV